MEKHPLHLKNPELQKSLEVTHAVKKHERLEDQKLPNDPNARIDAYMDRLEKIFLNPDERKRERNLEVFRDEIYDALIIKRENFPDSYFELQKRIARERGQVVEEIPDNVREQMMDVAIEDQKHSLDAWIGYLTSDDAVYPPWFKYYVWNQIIKLSQFDKERGEFKKRTDSTVAPFPDIYREPLAQIADLYERVKDDNKDSEVRTEFDKKFPTLYAELIQKSLAHQIENKENIAGRWIKYEQGNSEAAEKLFQSLEGKGTGWCTAGRSTAETQIESGDFYVYYTNDANGEPTQPRLAIRMEGQDRIGEVRGVLPHQGVEPLMQEVLDDKLREFGGEADIYIKKSNDMKRLTSIEEAMKENQTLSKDELRFLYEIDSTIEGFGYDRDPRIKEILNQRNRQEDIITLCDCPKEYITTDFLEITNETRVFAEDTGKKITFCDFREKKHKTKLPHLIELAKNLKESGSLARPDMSFEGGIVSIDVDPEKLKDLPIALTSYENADNKSPSWVWSEWKKMKSYTPPEATGLNVIILSYNSDTQTRASSDKILADMDKAGLRPVTIAELIALGIAKPGFNKRYDTYLVGLGTKEVLGDVPCAPSLCWDGDGRGLLRGWWSREWDAGDRFVCLRK